MPADISAISYFAPIAAFLIVFLVIFAVLDRRKLLGENKWFNLFVALFIASIFISAAGAINFIQAIIPWFAVLIVSVVLLMLLTGLIGKPLESMNRGFGIAAVVILILVFLISGFIIFSSVIFPYLPGPGFGSGNNIEATLALDYLYSPRISGAIILVIISAIVAAVLVKNK